MCGRKVAGQYVCQGKIAMVVPTITAIVMPAGLKQRDDGWIVPTARSEAKLAVGRRPAWRKTSRTTGGRVMSETVAAKVPARRRCPDCSAVAVITDAVLEWG